MTAPYDAFTAAAPASGGGSVSSPFAPASGRPRRAPNPFAPQRARGGMPGMGMPERRAPMGGPNPMAMNQTGLAPQGQPDTNPGPGATAPNAALWGQVGGGAPWPVLQQTTTPTATAWTGSPMISQVPTAAGPAPTAAAAAPADSMPPANAAPAPPSGGVTGLGPRYTPTTYTPGTSSGAGDRRDRRRLGQRQRQADQPVVHRELGHGQPSPLRRDESVPA
jgi:hypothetical protein